MENIGVLDKGFSQHVKMCGMILKVSLSIRKSIELGPSAFLSLNLLRVVINSASVKGLSGVASKCMSLLLIRDMITYQIILLLGVLNCFV